MTKPVIISATNRSKIDLLKKSSRIWQEVDTFPNQIMELFKVIHPSMSIYTNEFQEKFRQFSKNKGSNWVYFPWSGKLVRALQEQEYFLLRTNRNRNLITQEEQSKLHDTTIAIAGLSIGSHLAMGLTAQGIGKTLKLAEFDSLETTNLNRMRATLSDLNRKKIEIVSEQLFELNPYLTLVDFPDGLNTNNLDRFVNSHPKPRIIFELIDDFEIKIRLRQAAKRAKIPVISYANLGDSILVDIERYDQNPKAQLFNGIIGNLSEEIISNPDKKNVYAIQLVGIENVPQRALESVQEIGKSLTGRPQLSSTVSISAALGSYFARRIILEQSLPGGRTKIDLSKLLDLS